MSDDILSVGVFNIERFGWDKTKGHHRLPAAEDAAYRDSGFALCQIAARRVHLCCEHWSGGEGREAFQRVAQRVSTLGGSRHKTLLLGDFNADSGWEKAPTA